jgi:anti-anti-sigma factor
MAIDGEAAGPGLPALAERLSHALADGADVVLDLADVERLSSSLLATIVAADKTARANGCRIRLRRLRENVARTLARTGLDGRLHIVDGA